LDFIVGGPIEINHKMHKKNPHLLKHITQNQTFNQSYLKQKLTIKIHKQEQKIKNGK